MVNLVNQLPRSLKGMTYLNKELFKIKIQINSIRVPSPYVHSLMVKLKKNQWLFNIPRFKPVIPDSSNPNNRIILLSESAKNELPSIEQEISDIAKDYILSSEEITFDYQHFQANDILKAIIPDDIEISSAFETVGHIAHLNLSNDLLPYKHIIGQVLLEKNPKIKTVVNKTDNIENEFRVFPMEVLAGEPNFVTEIKESQCIFTLDYSKVYWNSRLHTEHARLVSKFQPGQFICDLFAGIGPFAIPSALKKCHVYATDLNPDSFKFLEINISRNKVQKFIQPSNKDAREFVTFSLEKLRESYPNQHFHHYIMNLPGSAYEFLDAFRSVGGDHSDDVSLPMIHLYLFKRTSESIEDIYQKLDNIMQVKINRDSVEVHEVRSVAPSKDMLCLSFPVQKDLYFQLQNDHPDAVEPLKKRVKLE